MPLLVFAVRAGLDVGAVRGLSLRVARRAAVARRGLGASVMALAVLSQGCKDDSVQSDTVVPAPAASALAATADNRCLSDGFEKLLVVSDDFPLCVTGLHAALYPPVPPDTTSQSPLPFSRFGQPSWGFSHGGPLTGGAARSSAATTTIDKWTVKEAGLNRSPMNRGYLDVKAGALPAGAAFTSTLDLPLGNTAFAMLSYATATGTREGEIILVNNSGNVRSSVNGVLHAAAPPSPTAANLMYYTGLSAIYVDTPPATKAPGLYRVSCTFDDASACTSVAIASWTDVPGVLATDLEGNLVAVHSSLGTGQEVLGFSAGSLSKETSGTKLKSDGNVALSAAIIGKAETRKLVLVETSNTGLPLDITLRNLTFNGDTASLSEPSAGSIRAVGKSRLQVFHDAAGDLWIAADNLEPEEERTPTFFHFSAKRTGSP